VLEGRMVDIEELKREILERLRPLDPERVILFGSYAHGNPTEDSDIDLYVVTKDEFVPGSFREKADLRLKVSELLLDLRLKYPVDLIVHTRPMYREFRNGGSFFSEEIFQRGVILL
jgi:predicted nucleotidyltransferase